jgi:hypothetical protein
MAASAAAARQAAAPARAPARKPAPRRKPRPRPRQRPAPARHFQPAAAVALLPNAAVRSVGAIGDISDSSLIMRLTRGRGWIALLCALLGGIVALNVISLSLTAGSGRLSVEIDALKTDNSMLRGQIAERLSAARVEAAAANLGLANPNPQEISYLAARDGDAQRLAHLLDTGTFLTQPSQPSSYPAPGTSYAPVSTASPTTTTTETTTTSTTSAPPTATAPAAPPSTAAGGASSGSGSSGGSTGSTTGGVGL